MTPVFLAYNFTALLSMLPTAVGGRKRPVYDHYRPSFSFNTLNRISGEVSFPEQQEIKPGDTTKAVVKLLPSKHIRQNLKSGDAFTILEGARVVGTGVIQHIEKKREISFI